MNDRWYFVKSRRTADVPDQVLQAVGEDSIRIDDRSNIPVTLMDIWGYDLTAVRLVPLASGKEPYWNDERIERWINGLPELQKSQMADAMRRVRDEYEMERKNKIFIPLYLRGALLSTVQKSRDFLADMLERVETALPENDRRIHAIQRELDGWRAEIAEYDEILKAIVGEE